MRETKSLNKITFIRMQAKSLITNHPQDADGYIMFINTKSYSIFSFDDFTYDVDIHDRNQTN